MRQFYFLFLIITSSLFSQIPAGYYNTASGLYGEELRTALKSITSTGHIKLTYTSAASMDVWKAYQYTDVRPSNSNIIWDMYSDRPATSPAYTFTLYTNQCGTATMESSCYSREHCFPKSWWGGSDNSDNPQYTDLHHLFPADQYVNLKKSNYPIGKVSTTNTTWTSTNGSKVGNCGIPGYSGIVFEPIDEYKGDFARAYLYIITRYKDRINTWLTSNSNQQITAVMEGDTYKSWYLNMLIQWHINDPVSQKEINRNNAVYYATPQKNRNPFIDHPEYVDAIWNQASVTLSAPIAMTAQTVEGNEFSARWNPVEGADDGYLLDVSTSPTFSTILPQVANDLIISEYIEGSSYNKYLELYNGTGASINLSNYKLQMYANGSTTPTYNNTLTGIIAIGETVIYQHSSSTLYSGGISNTALNFNGNDAVALFKISTNSFVDILGQIGNDPGVSGWKTGEHATTGKTLVRNPGIFSGITVNPTTGFPTLSTEWDVSELNDVSNLGTHEFNTTRSVDNFLSGYQNKIISLQNTQSAAVINLIPNTTYYYRVRAKKGNILSPFSNTISVITRNETIWNGTSWSNASGPTLAMDAIINGDFNTTSNGSISCNNLTINNGFSLTLGNNTFTEGQNNITNNGALIIENNGSLVQKDNNAAYSGNPLVLKRKTTPMKQFDYTYWSSPLANQTLQTLPNPSLYYFFNTAINNWSNLSANTVMDTGKGYIARAPNNLNYSTPQIAEAVFNGIPNNGIINVPIIKGSGTFNLIGNPYPSAIDIDLFFANPSNQNIIDGTIYLWTHNTPISSSNSGNNALNYSSNDYAKYNLTGGVKTTTSGSGSVMPTGKIASGQGFFIEAKTSLPNGSYNVVFNNTMRIKTNNDLFFRTPIPGVTNLQESISEIERNRLWLNITNTSGAYNETLIGYVTGATNEYDSFYDGKTIQTGNPVNMYSILGNDELAIQGRALPFNNTEIIPIGFSTTLPDTLKISLENSDGLFIELEEIYIKDNHNNTIHNIKNNPIIFTSESGTFNNRFELFFQNTLSLSNHTIPHTQIVVMQNNNDYIVYSEYKLLRSVEIYNMLGKQIAVKKGINSFQSTISSVQSEDILLFKIILEDGSFIPKKVIRQTLK